VAINVSANVHNDSRANRPAFLGQQIMKLTFPEYIKAIDPYVPGKPLEEVEREYGIRDSIKLASNENPLGPSPKAIQAILKAMFHLHRYPDGAGHLLSRKIADLHNVERSNVVIGNGSDDIIALLVRALIQPGDQVIVPRPSFLMYDITATAAGASVVSVRLKNMSIDLDAMANAVTDKTRLLFVCNPNNPTGSIVYKDDFYHFLNRLPDDVVVVVDEAYIDFVRDPRCLLTGSPEDLQRPLVTLRTFSKAYGLAGLRVGYGVMGKELSQVLNRVRQPFNVNSLAQSAAAAALEDKRFLQRTVDLVHRGLDTLYAAMNDMGLRFFSSQANFFLIDVKQPADQIFEKMLRQGVIVRSMRSYGYPTYIRINIGVESENKRFVSALKTVL
jgi:histidinol-phosphate aminotransferase